MHCDWLPGGVHTHTSGDTASQVFSHLISSVCVYVSKAEPVSQPDLHVVYRQTMPNCPWIGELASSPTESSKAFDTVNYLKDFLTIITYDFIQDCYQSCTLFKQN